MSGLTKGVGHKLTICEMHRELYDLAHANLKGEALQAFTDKLEAAYLMGKKMHAKLRQYDGGFDTGWYERQLPEITAEKLALRAQRRDG
jgi:hypothetical protein